MLALILNIIFLANSNIEAVGIGKDLASAKKDAFRNAVEKNVGIYIDSKTVTNNSMLIADSILNYSNGYIQTYDILEQNCRESLCTVKISATVENENIKKRLGNIGIIENVNLDKIGAIAATKELQATQKFSLLNDLKDSYPEGAYEIEYRDVSYINATDYGESKIRVNFFINLNDAYVDKMEKIYKMISKSTNDKLQISKDTPSRRDEKFGRVDFVTKKSLGDLKATASYNVKLTDLFFYPNYIWPNVTINLKDANNNIIATKNNYPLDDASCSCHVLDFPYKLFNTSGVKFGFTTQTEAQEIFTSEGSASGIIPFVIKYHTVDFYEKNFIIAKGIKSLVSIPLTIPSGKTEEIKKVEITIHKPSDEQ